jgi:hypothetical protein
MSKKQKEILDAVKDNIEVIESERYNSKDPVITIKTDDTKEEVIIKLITAERTGAPLKYGKEFLNPVEDIAVRSFNNGIRTLNSWMFKKSNEYFVESATKTNNQLLQQRVTLFKQLNKLLNQVAIAQPDKILKRTNSVFSDVISSIKKYDLFSKYEKEFYLKAVEKLNKIVVQLDEGDTEIKTQQLLCKVTISLANREYLAANIWLYRIYLLNKEIFDNLASDNEILKKALKNLQMYIENETGLKEHVELPTMASAYDLNTIFIDHLTSIYDKEFLEITKKNFSFSVYREG